jgi:DNA/RNA endonuclease YhcR with UshA esterase domain
MTKAGSAIAWVLCLSLLAPAAVPRVMAAGPSSMPIAAARQQAQGTTVTVEGLVTVPSGDFRSSSEDEGFAIQDQTAGIWVSLMKNLHLRLGQRVQVTGSLGESEEKLQIVAEPSAVRRLPGKELRVATGQVGSATLGYLITVEGTVTQPVENDPPYGWKVFIDDGSGSVQVYLNASTDIDPHAPWFKPGRQIRVTGFGNQYGSTYEVDPRSRRDIRALR